MSNFDDMKLAVEALWYFTSVEEQRDHCRSNRDDSPGVCNRRQKQERSSDFQVSEYHRIKQSLLSAYARP